MVCAFFQLMTAWDVHLKSTEKEIWKSSDATNGERGGCKNTILFKRVRERKNKKFLNLATSWVLIEFALSKKDNGKFFDGEKF